MFLGRERQPQLHRIKTAITEIRAVKLGRNHNLTLNRPSFSESDKAGGRIPLPPSPVQLLYLKANDHEIMSKALPGYNKTLDDVMTMTFL